MKYILCILFLVLATNLFAQQEVSFTLDDRDRLIRLEERLASTNERINSLEKQMNVKFNSIQRQFTFLYWALSILIGLVIINLGYTIWDRRTAIYPIRERLKEVEQDKVEINKIKSVLKEMGENDQKIAEILKRTAIF